MSCLSCLGWRLACLLRLMRERLSNERRNLARLAQQEKQRQFAMRNLPLAARADVERLRQLPYKEQSLIACLAMQALLLLSNGGIALAVPFLGGEVEPNFEWDLSMLREEQVQHAAFAFCFYLLASMMMARAAKRALFSEDAAQPLADVWRC